jgi:hypothetical protein
MGKVLHQVQQQHQGDIALRDRVIVQAKSELQKTNYEVHQKNQELHLYQGALSNAGGDSIRRHAELQQVLNAKNHFENEVKNMSDKQQQYVEFAQTEQQAAAQANASTAQLQTTVEELQTQVANATAFMQRAEEENNELKRLLKEEKETTAESCRELQDTQVEMEARRLQNVHEKAQIRKEMQLLQEQVAILLSKQQEQLPAEQVRGNSPPLRTYQGNNIGQNSTEVPPPPEPYGTPPRKTAYRTQWFPESPTISEPRGRSPTEKRSAERFDIGSVERYGEAATNPQREIPNLDLMEQLAKWQDRQKTKEADSIKIEYLPSVPKFKFWRLQFKRTVASASSNPDKIFVWISQVESAKSWKELNNSGEFASLDAKLATALGNILTGELARQINVVEERLALQMKMIKGRQIAWMIFEHFRITETEGAILEFEDLIAIELRGDNIKQFLNDWESCLINLKAVPPPEILESLFRKQLERSDCLKNVMSLYNLDITHNGKERSYERLLSMIRSQIEDNRRRRNRDEMSHRGKGRANPATSADPKKKQGDCHQFMNNGICSRENCPWNHPLEHGQRKGSPEGRSSSPNGGKGKGGKKGKGGTSQSPSPQKTAAASQRGTSPKGTKDRPTCSFYMRGACTRGKECDFFHVPVCTHFKKGSCTSGAECKFLHPRPTAATAGGDSKPEQGQDEQQEWQPAGTSRRAKSRERSAAAKAAEGTQVVCRNSFACLANEGVRWPKAILRIAAKHEKKESYTLQSNRGNKQFKERHFEEEIEEDERWNRMKAFKLHKELYPNSGKNKTKFMGRRCLKSRRQHSKCRADKNWIRSPSFYSRQRSFLPFDLQK